MKNLTEIKMENNMKIFKAINHTQKKLDSWYINAKKDFGVIGSAQVFIYEDKNNVTIKYKEDGIEKIWSMPFYPEYLENGMDWIFNCWAEF